MTPYSRPLIATLLLCAAQLPAAAQTRSTWSVQGSALYAGLGGRAYKGIDPGAGFELQGRRKLDPLWSLGCGVQGTYHSLSSFSGSETLEGLFCEPRKLVDINSERVFPYLSARAALLRQRITSGDDSRSAKGLALNIGTGIMMPIANTAGNYPTLLEIGASGGYTQFGNFTKNVGGLTVENDQPNGGGWNFVVRVGVAVGLPYGTPKRP
jgi:hypothetical protein